MRERETHRWDHLEQWWRTLDARERARESGADLARRRDRALLRRCRTLDEVQLTRAFCDVREGLRADGFEFGTADADERLACVVGLVAWVESNATNTPFRRQLGRRRSGSGVALLTGIRFRRLLLAHDRHELFELMMPTLDLLERTANVVDLANDIYEWAPHSSNSVRRAWAEGYYTAVPTEL